jgi:amino acid transporter
MGGIMSEAQSLMPTDDRSPYGFPEAAEDKGLKGGALGLLSSVVIGVSSTAPAYSLAASLGFIIAGGGAVLAGVKAPAIILMAFVPMYFIAVAYQELNREEPDCGTTFTWAARAFGPKTGWLGGWGIIAADVIVMANLAQIAGAYSFLFLADLGLNGAASLADSTFWSTVAGVVWIAIMTYVCYRGIEVSARFQYVLLGIEGAVLAILAGVALVKVYTGHGQTYSLVPSLSWLWPAGPDFNFAVVVPPALLTAVFIYWGWDTAVSVNEESDDPGRTPGRAGVISTVLLLAMYVTVTVAVIAYAGVGTTGIGLGNEANAADVFQAIGSSLFGDSTFGRAGVLLLSASILTSAAASTQTTILPTARATLSMGVFGAIPKRFAKIHPKYLTPSFSTLMMGAVSILFYILFTLVSPNLLAALIGSVGLLIAFYYGLTGFACVWYFRRTLTTSVRNFVKRGVMPLLGGLILLGAFVYAVRSFAAPDWLVDEAGNNVEFFGIGVVAAVGVASILLGVVLMLIWGAKSPAYFRQETLAMRSAHDFVLAGPHEDADSFRLPDSGLPEIVISPDLSNLPVGARAVDLESGELLVRAEDGEIDVIERD